MTLPNDSRGWIMTGVSGFACVVGASIICIDLIVRLVPRFRTFRIQDSNAFLSSSLSLSFGVMLYSALYSMLPSAKTYLIKGGYSPRSASYILIACFLGGVIGIQFFSRLLHNYIPSHVVGCDHSHDELDADYRDHDHRHNHDSSKHVHNGKSILQETMPLLASSDHDLNPKSDARTESDMGDMAHDTSSVDGSSFMRPSLQKRLTRKLTFLMGTSKPHCDEGGPCHGFTDPCGQECFKAISRSPTRAAARQSVSGSARSIFSRRQTESLVDFDEERGEPWTDHSGDLRGRRSRRESSLGSTRHNSVHWTANEPDSQSLNSTSKEAQHHHHVASNAFLSIGLQTSIAIALHKLPEGFITYATNHANPKLGFAVFMALFIHNITEGFAMALPLYLAINNRLKAMIISAFLGGVTQPFGAGIAALWLQTAQRHDMIPGEKFYGAMFSVTSGIMTSVALQLFAESLSLTHSKNLCIAFAFIGMGILGISNALTA